MILDRRNRGLLNVHLLLLALEAALVWVGLSYSGIGFTTLLPYAVYPTAVILGVLLSRASGAARFLNGGGMQPSYMDAIRTAITQISLVCVVVFSVVVLFKDPGISRRFLLLYVCVMTPVFVLLNRYQPGFLAWRFWFGSNRVATLFVGEIDRFPDFSGWLQKNRQLGLEPVGVIEYRGRALNLPGVPTLGGIEDLEEIIAGKNIRQIVVLDQPEHTKEAESLVRACLKHGCRLLIHNNFGYKLGYPLTALRSGHYSFLSLQDEPLEDPSNQVLKRALDLIMALFVLLVVFPPLAIVVIIMHRLQSPGPLFFGQTRTGHNQVTFRILKFRSMHLNGDESRQATGGDVRLFPFGSLLRRTSLDEIPQFVNVLLGDMSTVGPRPHLTDHSAEFRQSVENYLLRYFAKPGITGLAQCSGFRGETNNEDKIQARVRLDLDYIRNWSIYLDIWIILKTIRQVLFPPKTAV